MKKATIIKKEYQNNFENQGNCPNCNSENITYGESYIDELQYCYEFVCDDCGCKGEEWYNLEFDQTVVNDNQ